MCSAHSRTGTLETAGLSVTELDCVIDAVQSVVAAFAESGEIPEEPIDALPV